MSMMKKTAALTVSAVLLLQPMTASAVTWNNIVTGLRNSGSNRYTEDGTTIEQDGDNYTISGGKIEGDSGISWKDFKENSNFLFKDLQMDGNLYALAERGRQFKIEVGQNTLIKDGVSGSAEGLGNSVIIINNGNVSRAHVWANDGGYVSITNNGIAREVSGNSSGNGSICEIENTENGLAKFLDICASGQNSEGSAVNNGIVEYVVLENTDAFEEKHSGYTVNYTNNGKMGWMEVTLSDGTINVKNNGTCDEDGGLNVWVRAGTSIEEILQQTKEIPYSKNTYIIECEQDEYDVWRIVNEYHLGEENIEPDSPETEETPEHPNFEVSKYDQERHEMEEKRKAEAIGGVYGSPYWVKQLYLGYHSLNLRLFVGDQQSNFKQSLSWMPDSTKQLTLRVNTDAPEKLTMRLDEKVLETLERTEFSVITLLDKSGNAVMQYSLSDLRSAYDQYGLNGEDQLVVGGANDDVVKIVNGEIKPIEE